MTSNISKISPQQISIQKSKTNANYERNIPKEYDNFAKSMESEFVKYLLEQMRNTIQKDEPDSSELNYYHSLEDSEYANLISLKGDGIGIKKMILKQIYPSSDTRNLNKNVNFSDSNKLETKKGF